MHFAPTDEQQQFIETISAVLKNFSSPEALRKVAEDSNNRIPGLWETLSETGIFGLCVSEKYGGLGIGNYELVLALEEFGRAGCSEPILEHAAVAAPIISRWAPEPMASEWLERSLTGEILLTAGFPFEKRVVASDRADLLLLCQENELHVVSPKDVIQTQSISIDSLHKSNSVEWSPSPTTLIADSPEAVEDLINRGALASAAQSIGVAQQLLDMTVSYVKEREQFGKPVGTNQAVKHHCSNMAIAIEFARPVIQVASWALTKERSPTKNFSVSGEVSAAKALASEAVDLACRLALQCHGAIGYTVEYDLQIWMKRGWTLSSSWGDGLFHRRRLAKVIGLEK